MIVVLRVENLKMVFKYTTAEIRDVPCFFFFFFCCKNKKKKKKKKKKTGSTTTPREHRRVALVRHSTIVFTIFWHYLLSFDMTIDDTWNDLF